MSRAQQRRNNKQDAQAFGCLVGVIVFIAALGYNAVFGDDDKPKPKPMALPSRTSTPTPTTTQKPDKAAKTACANLMASSILLYTDLEKRSGAYLKASLRAASKSAVKELREAAAKPAEDADLDLRIWCGRHLPDIDEDTVDKHLPSFRKEHKQVREAEAASQGGNGSGSRGGNRGGRSGWRW